MISESINRAIHAALKTGETMSAEERVTFALVHIGNALRQAKTDPVAVQVLGDQLIEYAQGIVEDLLG